jgi:regulatory protein
MIYEVKKVEKNKKDYTVYFQINQKEESFDVSDEIILDYRLVKGKILEDEKYAEFKEAVLHDQYRQKLWHYATYKPRTIQEARQYLDQFDVPEAAKAKYIEKLKEAHILDDELYVKNYIEEYSSYRMIGPRKIEMDLRNKGISTNQINRMMGLYKASLMKENIKHLLEKKIKSSKNKPLFKLKESIKSYLMNKGYDYEMVNGVVDEMSSDIKEGNDEDMALQKDFDQYLNKYKRSNQSQSFRDYLIPKLMQKGYPYHKIIKFIEGENL